MLRICDKCSKKYIDKTGSTVCATCSIVQTTSEVKDYLYKNWGGHLFNPPKECKYSFTANDGGKWTDLLSCTQLCSSECKERKDFKGKTSFKVRRELKQQGVRI